MELDRGVCLAFESDIEADEGWELDFARGELRRGDEPVPLRPKPFALLLYLIQHRDRLVAKDELLEAVWPGVRVSEAALTSAVKALRRALGDDGVRQVFLETRRGRGYRFIAPVREMPKRSPLAEDGFVGRTRDLEALEDAANAALAGNGRLVTLRGEAGIGKTRLLAELERRLRQRGVSVGRGWCSEDGGSPPFWPWRRLAVNLRRDGLLAEPVLASLAGILAPLVAELPATSGGRRRREPDPEPGARYRLFDATYRLLAESARPNGLVLLLDDMHAADAASLQLLAHLARELPGTRLLVVAAFREPAAVTDAVRTRVAGALASLPQVGAIRLERLEHEDAEILVRRVAGPAASAERVEAAVRRAEGNPFFLRELARADGPSAARIPAAVRDALRSRIERLPEATQQALAAGAIVGREFSPDLLAGVLGIGLAQVRSALAEAEREGLVAESPRGFAFEHALVAETLRSSLGPARRSDLHLRIGEALEEAAVDAAPEELVRHFEAAGATAAERAVEYAHRAALRAMEMLAFEDAVAHMERALRAADLLPRPDPALRGELFEILGRARTAAGASTEEIARAFDEAIAIARKRGDPEALAQAVVGLIPIPLVRRGQIPLIEEALRLRGELEDEVTAGLLTGLAIAHLVGRRQEQAESAADRALAIAERCPDGIARYRVLTTKALIGEGQVTPEERLSLLRRAIQAAEEVGRPALEIVARGKLFFPRAELGDPEAGRESEAFARFLEAHRLPRHRPMLLRQRAVLALLAGDPDGAERFSAEALDIARTEQNAVARRFSTLFRGLCQRERGDAEGALETFGSVLDDWGGDVMARCGRVDCWMRLGSHPEAERELALLGEEAVDTEPQVGRPLVAAWIAEACWALGDAERAVPLLAWIRPAVGRHVVAVEGTACFGSAARYAGLLAWTAAHPEQAEALLRQALTENESAGADLFAAHTRCDLARLLMAVRGRRAREEALQHLAEAEAWAAGRPLGALQEDLRAARSEASGAIPLRGRRPA